MTVDDAATIRRDQSALRDIAAIRAQFPGLNGPDILLDNAGGSQVPEVVANRIRDYMCTSYVQLGADYATSRTCAEIVSKAHTFIEQCFGGVGAGHAVLGASSSALLNTLANAYLAAGPSDRNEIIVSEANHESNIGPWLKLERFGFKVRWWRVDPDRETTPIKQLESMLSDRTLLVAFPHVTNIFGAIEDADRICVLARAAGARSVVDSVAFAPHRPLDVVALGADWCVYSTYKVFGPHMGAMFGTHEAFSEVIGPNHAFIDRSEIPRKFELGGVNHEGCAGLLGLWDYAAWLVGEDPSKEPTREALVRAFDTMDALERPLQKHLIDWLIERDDLRIIGPATSGPERAPTVSFIAPGRSSREIAQRLNAEGLGVRHGHFYSKRLVEALGLDPDDGVIRASLAHYNTIDEIDRLTESLRSLLG